MLLTCWQDVGWRLLMAVAGWLYAPLRGIVVALIVLSCWLVWYDVGNTCWSLVGKTPHNGGSTVL